MPHSHHSHSGQFCKHASGLLEDVVLEAISQGFEVYGLTEHVPRYRESDLYPEEAGFSLDALSKQFDDFLAEAHRLKRQYASKLNILVGLETESITSADLDGLQALLERVGDRIEYIVGSVHHVNEIPIDFDVPTYQTALESFANSGEDERLQMFLSSYFDAQYELLQRFRPEVIGHFDLCRLYTPTIRFSDYPSVCERVERNITYAVEYGALFEVNTAAFRKNWDSAYPAEDIVKAVLKHGGHFALSDDSHGPHAVGLNYHRVVGYLQSVGVSEIWYLKSSSSTNAAGRTMAPVKLDGDWWNHPFWRKRAM